MDAETSFFENWSLPCTWKRDKVRNHIHIIRDSPSTIGAGVSHNFRSKFAVHPQVDEGDTRTPQGGILGARLSRKMRAQRFNDN